jgi:hypothetical protein
MGINVKTADSHMALRSSDRFAHVFNLHLAKSDTPQWRIGANLPEYFANSVAAYQAALRKVEAVKRRDADFAAVLSDPGTNPRGTNQRKCAPKQTPAKAATKQTAEMKQALKDVQAKKALLASVVSMSIQSGRGLMAVTDKKKGAIWCIYRAQELWDVPGICAGMITATVYKHLDDASRYALMVLLFPEMNLPAEPFAIPSETSDTDRASLLEDFRANLQAEMPNQPITASKWAQPKNAVGKWNFGFIRSKFANACGACIVLCRQLTNVQLDRLVAKGRLQIRDLPGGGEAEEEEVERGVYAAEIELEMERLASLKREVYEGKHDKALVTALEPFPADGKRPLGDRLEHKWANVIVGDLATGNDKSKGQTRFNNSQFHLDQLQSFLDLLLNPPRAADDDDDELDIGVSAAALRGRTTVMDGDTRLWWSLMHQDMTHAKAAKKVHPHIATPPSSCTRLHTRWCVFVDVDTVDRGHHGHGEGEHERERGGVHFPALGPHRRTAARHRDHR